ncbi:hypothetical protein DFH27DRAFT_521126 [Peziza echinospora]|nr:hypothetical protein DFH27DRAFT_521126 [Peziza echinospora]
MATALALPGPALFHLHRLAACAHWCAGRISKCAWPAACGSALPALGLEAEKLPPPPSRAVQLLWAAILHGGLVGEKKAPSRWPGCGADRALLGLALSHHTAIAYMPDLCAKA